MRNSALLPSLAALCTGAFLLGCPSQEPPTTILTPPRNVTSQELLAEANASLRAHLMGGESAANAIDLDNLFGSIANAPPCAGEGPCDDQPEPIELNGEETAQMFADEVLNIANVEESTATSVTLRFDTAMCRPEEGETPDPECVAEAERLQPRLRLDSRRAGDVNASFTLGAARNEIFSLELYTAHLAVEVDLGAAKRAIDSLAGTMDDFPPELLAAMVSGRVRAEFGPGSGQAYSARLAIVSRVVIDTTLDNAPLHLALETASPLAVFTLDPTSSSIIADLSSGGANLIAPLNLLAGQGEGEVVCTTTPEGETVCDEPVEREPLIGSVELILPAATARITASNTDNGRVENLSLDGAIEAKLDGRSMFALELGATANGGAFDLSAQSMQENVSISVTPSMRFLATFDLSQLALQIEDIPSWLVNERLEVQLNGAASPSFVTEQEGEQVRMTQGRLSIDSRAANRQIEINSGECLVSRDVEPMGGQHPLELLEKAACR